MLQVSTTPLIGLSFSTGGATHVTYLGVILNVIVDLYSI